MILSCCCLSVDTTNTHTQLMFMRYQDASRYQRTIENITFQSRCLSACLHRSFVPGFNGTNCENNIDDCPGHQCANGGTCMDGVNTYNCQCPPEWTGKGLVCSMDITTAVAVMSVTISLLLSLFRWSSEVE